MCKATTILIYLIGHKAITDIYVFLLPLPILNLPCPQTFRAVDVGRKGKSISRIFVYFNEEKSAPSMMENVISNQPATQWLAGACRHSMLASH